MDVKIEPSWKQQLADEFSKPYFEQLTQFVRQEYASGTCYPPGRLIFNAFDTTPFNQVRVVILGQDPYHGPGQAHGLCFSVNDGIPFPPSLQNIFKEIQAETGAPIPQSGNLTRWAETFTDAAISALSRGRDNLVFMLWGAPAGRKASLIDQGRHLVLMSAHPSPLSAMRGFMGNGHFLKCNEYLTQHGQRPIVW